ncbi:MAG: radical SAM protein [Planctomycetota bacterium]
MDNSAYKSSNSLEEVPLAERLATAEALLHKCTLCEHRCGVDRTIQECGTCRLGRTTRIYKRYTSMNEEPELLPALRLFVGGCNLRCVFCDEAPRAFQSDLGEVVHPAELAQELATIVNHGARSISLLGGEPSLHLHTILALAAAVDKPLPLALNSNMFMTPETLALLSGVVRWYLADLKFGNDSCAREIAGVADYSEIVRRNILHAAGQTEVIVRHVLLPGHLECCFRPLINWLSRTLPGIRFQLYPGFVPCGSAAKHPTLARLNTHDDVAAAQALLRSSNLRWGVPWKTNSRRRATWHPDGTTVADITIGADGRLYCHDLTHRLVPVLAALCPDNPLLAERAAAAGESLQEQS